jgi:HAE1 family hydrophobic/amphiphilic exporter-1
MKLEKVYGLSEITRHNMYTSTEISGAAAVGYSSGTAIKVVQVAAAKLPRGYDIDWAGISADEVARKPS